MGLLTISPPLYLSNSLSSFFDEATGQAIKIQEPQCLHFSPALVPADTPRVARVGYSPLGNPS